MKVKLISGLVVILAALGAWIFMGKSNEVGDVSLGLFTLKDIKIERMVDPEVPGVTCFLAHIKSDLEFTDPSDTSIACRQTGDITLAHINGIDKSASGDVVFKTSKSIFFKSLKIRRIFDAKSSTLMYLSYSTTEIDGSYEHSLSTVPLYGNPVWAELEAQKQATK